MTIGEVSKYEFTRLCAYLYLSSIRPSYSSRMPMQRMYKLFATTSTCLIFYA